MSSLRIGCSSAFWGDSSRGAFQLVRNGDIDFLVADYLAEVTMGILARQKNRGGARGGMGAGGFVAEFVYSIFKPLMNDIKDNKVRIVTNAGAMNPVGCKEAIEEVARKANLPIPKVAAIVGDDLMPVSQQLKSENKLYPFDINGEEEPVLPDEKMCLSFNAYIGAEPIAQALREGAEIVITGRCVDSAMVLGPLLAHFYPEKPESYNYDFLSAGSVAGHIIECGCQATGGNFTDWEKSCNSGSGGWANMGFPIVEFSADGTFLVTKPKGTGGLVTIGTVSEQILYEIHDPGNYVLPDVVVDFRQINLKENFMGNKNLVKVSGCKGRPPTNYYKISGTFFDGYKLSADLLIPGFNAKEKGYAVANAIITRSRRLLKMYEIDDFIDTNIEVLGTEHLLGNNASEIAQQSREVIVRISVLHSSPKGLKIFGKEVAPSATGMAPGITGGASGRPRPAPLIKHYSCLVSKEDVPIKIVMGEEGITTDAVITTKALNHEKSHKSFSLTAPLLDPHPFENDTDWKKSPFVKVPLISLCFGRSGDKGDVVNVGLIARKPIYYPLIKYYITDEFVKNFFQHFCNGSCKRYELPSLNAFNFVLTKSLGGGGLGSLNIDRQGKTYAQFLLTATIPVPSSWIKSMNPSITTKKSNYFVIQSKL